MEAKNYSIVNSSVELNSNNFENETIYNIKLTDELVKKLIKGQKDLNNLTGIEFCISNNGGIDVNSALIFKSNNFFYYFHF